VTAVADRPARSVDTWLARFPVERPPVVLAGAAVTLVLRPSGDDVEVLLIERTVRPEDPASGQVALPGGRVADGDGNLAVTAERELEEEVGVGPSDLAGPLRFVAAEPALRFQLKVAIFAGALGPPGRPPYVHDAQEVAHVFWLPRPSLGRTERVHRETSRGLVPVAATVHEGHVVWGFTRRVLRNFFELPPEPELLPPNDEGSPAPGTR
jgi:8-oxo-dGTP pyrophosphatase MutT (NUDIX family)